MASKPKPDPSEPAFLADYRPVERQRARHDGWTAQRQRAFLTVLAETGCISEACAQVAVSSRSVYRLRQQPNATAFAAAYDQALKLATLRLTTIAFERAIRGTVREFWREGERVGETRTPSDKLLMYLLSHLLPRGAEPSRLDAFNARLSQDGGDFTAALDQLVDDPVEMVPVVSRDFFGAPPGDADEDW